MVPEVLADSSDYSDIADATKFYESDIVSSDVIDVEFGRWRNKWAKVEKTTLSSSGLEALRSCDAVYFLNINMLLRILCTLPVTSAESERFYILR